MRVDDMDEEILLIRAKEEREQIFERYAKGRQTDNSIEPWEDPSLEFYHRTDKYGFIHDSRSFGSETHISNYYDRSIELAVIREKKWLYMLRRWDKSDTRDKLRRRVYKGIPNNLRSEAWKRLLNVERTIEQNPGVYAQMLKLARTFSTEARQIDSDVNRQFREHVYYRERYSIKQKSLFNVLTAYSMYNMELGYCQGMAGVAGILLMYMDEEEAFWALSTFMCDPKYAMHGLFIEGFPKLTRFLAHHDQILAKFLPKLHKHFAKHCLDAILYSLKWFFVIFVERIPFSLCLRIWDIYMIEGERVVTAMAFTILRIHSKKLLKMRDMDEMTEFLQCQLNKNFGYTDDYVIKVLEQSMSDLRRYKMDLPPPPHESELPKYECGRFIEPDYESKVSLIEDFLAYGYPIFDFIKIGRRKAKFTTTERNVSENMIMRQEEMHNIDTYSYENADENVGSIKTYRSFNSLATSIATSLAISTQSLSSNGSDKSTEVTRL